MNGLIIRSTEQEVLFEALNVGDYFEYGYIFLKTSNVLDNETINAISLTKQFEFDVVGTEFVFYENDLVNTCETINEN